MPISEELLDAIAYVESRNNPKARGDVTLRHPALGAFQMRRPAYQDVQRIFPQYRAIPFERIATDPVFQREAARRYLEVGQSAYGITDPDRLISFYNAGPRARRGLLVNPGYVQKVKSKMGNPTLKRFHDARP